MNFKAGKIRLPNEVSSVEMLRGIASSMVCYFHLSRGNPDYLPETSWVRQAGAYGWTGVEIFFVISGFVIPYAMFKKNYTISNFFTFLKKRIIRIEPPYLISIALVILLNYISTLSPYYKGAPFTADYLNIVSHIAYLNVFTGEPWLNVVYWSLAIEFQYYIIIALFFSIIVSESVWRRIIFFVAFIGVSFIPVSGDFILPFTPFFLLGILLFQFVNNKISHTEFFLLLAVTIVCLGYNQGIVLTLIAISTILVIVFVKRIPRSLKHLGHISYSLYLLHSPVGGRIINITGTLVQNVLVREIIVFISFGICIVLSSLFYKYVESYFKKAAARIRYRQGSFKKANDA